MLLLALLAILLVPTTAAADDFSPTVEITCPDYVALGGELVISVEISQSYIESSTFEVDTTSRPGWGVEEQSYFTFVSASEYIELLSETETHTFELTLGVLGGAPEKQYTIPLVFYGKAGECADGCVPFRIEYEVAVTAIDTQSAAEKISQAQDAYSSEDYAAAKRLYEDARAIYVLIGDEGSASQLDDDIAASQKGVEAMQLYESGNSKLTIGNKDAAKADFTASRQLFYEIGNTARVSELDGLIAQCQQPTETPEPEEGGESYTAYYFIAGVALIFIAALVALLKKQ